MNIWQHLSRPECYPFCSCEPMPPDCVICQPFAFWSSLAYLISAWLVFRSLKSLTTEGRYWLTGMVVLTLASFFAHASFSNLALAIDMAAIVNLLGFIHFPKITSDRVLKLHLGKFILLFLVLTMVLFLLPSGWWVSIVGLVFIISALHLWRETPFPLHREKTFIFSMLIYFISFLFFLFDKSPGLCEISWLPYGHTIWHFGSALTTYLFGRWYFIEMPQKTRT